MELFCLNDSVYFGWDFTPVTLEGVDFKILEDLYGVKRVYYWYATSLLEGRGCGLAVVPDSLFFWFDMDHQRDSIPVSDKIRLYGGYLSLGLLERGVDTQRWTKLKSLLMAAKEKEESNFFVKKN